MSAKPPLGPLPQKTTGLQKLYILANAIKILSDDYSIHGKRQPLISLLVSNAKKGKYKGETLNRAGRPFDIALVQWNFIMLASTSNPLSFSLTNSYGQINRLKHSIPAQMPLLVDF